MFGPRLLRRRFAIGALLASSAAGAVDVPDSVVRIERLAYGAAGGPTETRRGLLAIDLIGLRQATGLSQGYVNMSTAQGCVVRNLVVLDGQRFPYQTLATPFDLGNTVDSIVVAKLDFRPTLAVARASQSVRVEFRRRRHDTEIAVQLDHRGIEAASNAGGPTSVANSLDFLRRTTPLPLPHPHQEGLENDNQSLVGFVGRTIVLGPNDLRSGDRVARWVPRDQPRRGRNRARFERHLQPGRQQRATSRHELHARLAAAFGPDGDQHRRYGRPRPLRPGPAGAPACRRLRRRRHDLPPDQRQRRRLVWAHARQARGRRYDPRFRPASRWAFAAY